MDWFEMRVKCPRCGLVNKPDVKKCQSCGEDFSDLLGIEMDMPIKERPDQLDPLSIDNIKMNRRRERSSAKESAKIQQKPLDLDWREELKQRVSQIKKERVGRAGGLPPDASAARAKEIRGKEPDKKGRAGLRDEINKYELPDDKIYDEEDEERALIGKSKKYAPKSSDVYDDNHREDYDYDTEESEEELEAGHPYEDEREARYPSGEELSDEENGDESDISDQPIPSDPEDVRRFIAEKVARRKARSGGSGRALSEEYGYKPKTRGRTSEKERVSTRKPSRADIEIESPDSPYDSRSIYRPMLDEKPETPSDRLLSEETRSLINSKRIYAGLWDNIILLVIAFIIIKFGAGAINVTISQLFSASWQKLIIFYLLLSGFYNAYFIGSNGQTIGKMFMHIRLMTVMGKQISFSRAFFHFVFSVIGIAFATIGFFWLLFNKESRNWADIVTGVKTELYRS
jgi:uncharacterized RDD family membrane protein YckC